MKSMKKKNNWNLNALLVGVGFLLVNSVLDLGVLPYINDLISQNGMYNVAKWGLGILSSVLLAVGLALIISVITNRIEKNSADYSCVSKNEAISIINSIMSNSYNKDFNEYKSEQVQKIMETQDNIRTNTTYNVQVYVKNGKVYAKTTQSFIEWKTSDDFGRISNFSNSENMIIESVKISDPNNSYINEKFVYKDIKKENSTVFSEDLKFERFVEIPDKFKNNDSLLIEKVFTIVGEDHWLNYALMFMRPSLGVNFRLTTTDGLIIKEVTIFGDDKLYTKDQKEDTLSINSTKWISNNNGFSIIIAKKD